MTNHSSVIHEYYARECRAPVHVTLDTALGGARMGLKAYVCCALGVPGGRQGCMFTPIPATLAGYEPEAVALALCARTGGEAGAGANGARARLAQPASDLAQVGDAAARLATLVDQVLGYVEDVLAGRAPGDAATGRELLRLVHAVPAQTPDLVADAFAAGVKDLLMVCYPYCFIRYDTTLISLGCVQLEECPEIFYF